MANDPIIQENTTVETIATDAQKGGTEITAPEVQQTVGQLPAVPIGGLQTVDGQPVTMPTSTTPTQVETSLEGRVSGATSSAVEQIAKAESIADLERIAIEKQQKAAGEAQGAKGQVTETLDSIKQLEEERKGRGEIREGAEEEVGIIKIRENRQAQSKKVALISGELEKIKVQETASLQDAENKVASTGTINAAKRRIQTEFARLKAFKAAELNAESALLAVYNDELQVAQARVDDFIQDATYDDQIKFQRLSFILEQEKEFFNSLNGDSKEWLQATMTFAGERLEQKQERLRTVMNLQIEAAKSGITLGWSTERISEFAADDGGVAAATNVFNGAVAPVERRKEAGVKQTQTERALVQAEDKFIDKVDPNTGKINLTDYIEIRSQSPLDNETFNGKFGSRFLSDGDQNAIKEVENENACLILADGTKIC